MKRFALVLSVMAMVACGGGGSDGHTYSSKIADWQAREAQAPPIETICPWGGSLQGNIRNILDQISVPYEKDPDDYWQSSDEILYNGQGDCEDAAHFAMRAIYDSCLPEKFPGIDVRALILGTDNPRSDHVILVVYYGNTSFEIDNFQFFQEREHRVVKAEYDLRFIF